MSWTIYYVDGGLEVTPPEVDKLQPSVDQTLLFASSTRTYGPDEVKATYVLANVRKWERNK